jgi:hypothetical protein
LLPHQVHSRHLPVFGLVAEEADARVKQLIGKIASSTIPVDWQFPTWQTGGHNYCSNSEIEDLATDLAELGEEIFRQHIYDWDNSPNLHASESRRMTFNERWSYASIGQGRAITSQDQVWTRELNDDTILPSLSVEWAVDEGAAVVTERHLYSKTGYCIKLSSSPALVILNRHYPHWRTSEVDFIQFIPPAIPWNRGTADNHRLNGSANRAYSLYAQLHIVEDILREARRGFQSQQSLSQAILGQFSQYIMQHANRLNLGGDPALHSLVQSLASSCKDVIDRRKATSTAQTTFSMIYRLLSTSFRYLAETCTLSDEERQIFASTLSDVMIMMKQGSATLKELSPGMIDCFLITSRLASANSLVLCGKPFLEAEWLPLQHVVEEAPFETFIEEEVVDAVAEEVIYEEELPEGGAMLADEDVHEDVEDGRHDSEEDALDYRSASCELPQYVDTLHQDEDAVEEADSDYHSDPPSNDHEDVYKETDNDSDTLVEGSRMMTRKRAAEQSLSNVKTKHMKADDKVMNSSKKTVCELDGGAFKRQMICIMSKRSEDQKAKARDHCVKAIKASIQYELTIVKPISTEGVMACDRMRKLNEAPETSEKHAWVLMFAVLGACRKAEQESNDEDWDWILLTLAYHASKTVLKLAKEAEEAYRQYEESKPQDWTFQEHLETGQVNFSTPLIEILDQVKGFLESDDYKQGNRIDYARQQEVNDSLIKSLVRNLNLHDPTLTTRLQVVWLDEAPPTVYLTYVHLPSLSASAKKLDRNARRFGEAVYDVLFQAYFSPLISYLNRKGLDGEDVNDNEKYSAWVMQRKFLRLRLEIIDKMVDNCSIGTNIFASKACSNLILAPVKYVPLPKEKQGSALYSSTKGFAFPLLVIGNRKDASTAANTEGWEAIFSSFKAVKNNINRLATKKDPSRSITSI